MRAIKIIFINRYFYPDHSATSQLVSDLAFFLAERGHRVCVITSQQRYDAPDARLAAKESVKGVEVHRVWTSRFGRGFLPGRAMDYATFYLSTAWRLFRLAGLGDLVVAKTDPPLLSVVAGWVSGMRRARLVNWLQDLFPEVASALGIGLARGVSGRIIAWLRDRSLRSAVLNVAIGRLMRDRLIGLGLDKDRVAVIHNWVDDERIRPAHAEEIGVQSAHTSTRPEESREGNSSLEKGESGFEQGKLRSVDVAQLNASPDPPFLKREVHMEGLAQLTADEDAPRVSEEAGSVLRREWGLENRFVVGYSGNLGRAHEYRTLLAAAESLEDKKDVVFLFIGGGTAMDGFRREVETHGLCNVVFQPYQPLERLGASLTVPDVHLVVLRHELEGLIVPSKFYGVIAAGCPTIFLGSRDGEVAELLAEGEAGFTVGLGGRDALVGAILRLRGDSALCDRMGKNARRLSVSRFSRRMALDRWERLLAVAHRA